MAAGALGSGGQRFALIGAGVTNAACARALRDRGNAVVLTDDAPGAASSSLAEQLGVEFLHSPDREALADLMGRVEVMVPAPGLPESHHAFVAARRAGVPVCSEFDLAAAWDDRDVIAVTGTNGKTTVVTLVAAMLEASGLRTAAVGNLDVPLVEAIEDPDIDCFVVEASSFRLGHSVQFAPRVATWLNFSPDHLDVHRDLEAYRSAKARIWAHMGTDDTAVVAAEDPVVSAAAPDSGRCRVWRFGLGASAQGLAVDFHQEGDLLVGAGAVPLIEVGALWRQLPHDRRNALASAATALAAGATTEGIRVALENFGGLPHRVQLVGETGGVRFYDDSKATAPHATLAATSGFDSVVLLAGGRNKGLDLTELSAADSVRAVVGIGEAADEVLDAFAGRPGTRATSMRDAVQAAASMARPGEVVLLSPGCASFDWYSGYQERGDDFAAEVRRLPGVTDGD